MVRVSTVSIRGCVEMQMGRGAVLGPEPCGSLAFRISLPYFIVRIGGGSRN